MDRLYGVAERLIPAPVVRAVRAGQAGRAGRRPGPPRPAGRKTLSQALSWGAAPRVTAHCSPPLRPSGSCRTLVMDDERKSEEKRNGGGSEKRAVRGTCGFFLQPPSPVTVTNEGSIEA